jgi:hypothetical protein
MFKRWKALGIGDIGIGKKNISPLVLAVKLNKTLTYLDLSENSIKEGSLIALCEALNLNKNITG